jgi:hypothetical protein
MFRLLPSSDQYKIFNSLITYLCDILIGLLLASGSHMRYSKVY